MHLRRDVDLKGVSIDTQLSKTLASLISERISCRRFLSQPVPRSVIERILTLSQFAPTWCNTQPWEMIITEGDGTERFRTGLIEDLKTNPDSGPDLPFPDRYTGKFLERKRDVAWQLYSLLGIERGDREASARATSENFTLFNAPHAAIVTSERDLGVYGALDCAFYAAYFGLAAQSFGVASIPQAALAQRAPFIRRHFNVPDHRVVILGFSFGYPDRRHPSSRVSSLRAHLDDVVQWVEK
jgi:nitroreductase